MMNKAKSFRSRKVDAKRPLSVYRASEIPDLDENLSAQRSVPLVDTGVEKDEETVSNESCSAADDWLRSHAMLLF
jgi:hypothetical protein